MTGLAQEVLDNPAWHALNGPHRGFAQRVGGAARYRPEVSSWAAVQDWNDPGVWDDVLALVGPGETFPYRDTEVALPPGWGLVRGNSGVQMIETKALRPVFDPEVVRLGEADVPQMLDLVARTRPGPFFSHTYLLGTYLGIRHHGKLVAMAGERLHPPGWTEISAVCTDVDYRGRGLSTRLVLSVAAGIAERGERALLHAAGDNAGAIRLYQSLGFTLRRRTRFAAVRTPDPQ